MSALLAHCNCNASTSLNATRKNDALPRITQQFGGDFFIRTDFLEKKNIAGVGVEPLHHALAVCGTDSIDINAGNSESHGLQCTC